MEMQKSKVYVLLDSSGYITRIDGGYTIGNITAPENWVLIDEGNGDKYNLCQGNYFPQPIRTMGGAYRYKLIDGMVTECSESELLEQEEAQKRNTPPTLQDRVDALETTADDMILLMAEMIGGM